MISGKLNRAWIKNFSEQRSFIIYSVGHPPMDLPPIIVKAPNHNNAQQENSEPAPASNGPQSQGSIISINETNNFVIVDLGQENSNVKVGNPMKVYRNSSEIATLEVIQVRRDISAADIKDKSIELKSGRCCKALLINPISFVFTPTWLEVKKLA